MPCWYGEFAVYSFFIGIIGIFPSMILEVLLWGVVNGYIVLWIILLAFIPLISTIIFKDFRKYIFEITE